MAQLKLLEAQKLGPCPALLNFLKYLSYLYSKTNPFGEPIFREKSSDKHPLENGHSTKHSTIAQAFVIEVEQAWAWAQRPKSKFWLAVNKPQARGLEEPNFPKGFEMGSNSNFSILIN